MYSVSHTTVTKDSFPIENLRLPVSHQEDKKAAVLLYGNGQTVLDVNGTVGTLDSEYADNALFIIRYDEGNAVVNTDLKLRINAHIREASVIMEDNFIHVCGIIPTSTPSFPVKFYNDENVVDVFMQAPLYDAGNEIAFVATYSVLETKWAWTASAQLTTTTGPYVPDTRTISSASIRNPFKGDVIVFDVASPGNFELYNGDERVTDEVKGSAFIHYWFKKSDGTFIRERGLVAPETNVDELNVPRRTDFLTMNRDIVNNILSGSVVVTNTDGLVFRTTTNNGTISLPANHHSTLAFLGNQLTPDANQSLYHVSFNKDPQTVYDATAFQSVFAGLGFESYLYVLAKRTDANATANYQITTSASVIDTFSPNDMMLDNGYVLFQFSANIRNDAFPLQNVYTFDGAGATVTLQTDPVRFFTGKDKKRLAHVVLELEGCDMMRRFAVNAAYDLSEQDPVTLPSTGKQVAWLSVNNTISYNSYIVDKMVGQKFPSQYDDILSIALYSTATTNINVESSFLPPLLEYTDGGSALYEMISVDSKAKTTVLSEPWFVMIIVLISFIVASMFGVSWYVIYHKLMKQ